MPTMSTMYNTEKLDHNGSEPTWEMDWSTGAISVGLAKNSAIW